MRFFGMGIPEMIFLFIGLVNFIIVAFVARYAHKKKGYSFWLFLLLGIFSTCVVQSILAMLLPDNRKTTTEV